MHESLIKNTSPAIKELRLTICDIGGYDLLAEAEEVDDKRVANLILEAAGMIDRHETMANFTHDNFMWQEEPLGWAGDKAEYTAQAENIVGYLEDIVWNDFIFNLTAEQKAEFEQIIKFHPTAQLALTEKCKAKSLKNIIEKWNNLQEEKEKEKEEEEEE